jgi:hypothetical protein
MIRRFNTIRDFFVAFDECGASSYGDGSWNSWYGPDSADVVRLKSITGDRDLVPAAESMLRQLQTNIETPRLEWHRNVAGPVCVVPDVLSGSPTPFRRQVFVREANRPIEIFVDVGSSASIKAETLRKRGTAILALVMALARLRPVALNLIDCSDGNRDGSGESVVTIRLETAPLDIAKACYALTNIGLVRGYIYDFETETNNFAGGWPKGFSFSNQKSYYDKLMPRLTGNLENSLLVEASRANDPLIKSPVEWINEQIRKFTSQQEEAA